MRNMGTKHTAIEGADAPYEDWLRQYFYPLPILNKNEPPAREVRAQGAPAIEGANAPYEDWLRQCFYPHSVLNKNEPPT